MASKTSTTRAYKAYDRLFKKLAQIKTIHAELLHKG